MAHLAYRDLRESRPNMELRVSVVVMDNQVRLEPQVRGDPQVSQASDGQVCPERREAPGHQECQETPDYQVPKENLEKV